MKIRIVIIVFALVLTISTSSVAKTFGAEEFTLSNGMQVVVIPNHRAPVVTHMLWVKVGGADNLPSQSGMAHYFEHLMFKGTKTIAPGDYSKTIKTLGGNDNAFTGLDYTAYFATLSVDNLPKLMQLEADRFQNLAPPQDHFKSEKSVVLEERRQRTENDPKSLFVEQMNSALFTNHPYNTPVIGWMDEIESYEWNDVKKYYDEWYAPNNMILVVSGDITAEKLKPLAEKYYAPIPKKILPKRLRPNIPNAIGYTVMTLRHAQIHKPIFYKAYIAPTEKKERHDSLALQILANILSGGPTTRLYQKMVVDQKKAVNVAFSYDANALDYGTISIQAMPADGVPSHEIANLIEQEITDIIQNGVSENEVKDSIQRLQDEAVFARDSIAGPAMIFGHAMTTGSTVNDVENWPDDISQITAVDVQAAAKTYLDSKKPWVRPPITGYLLPEEKSAPVKEESTDVRKQ